VSLFVKSLKVVIKLHNTSPKVIPIIVINRTSDDRTELDNDPPVAPGSVVLVGVASPSVYATPPRSVLAIAHTCRIPVTIDGRASPSDGSRY